jgi:Zn-dependent peptidase ImmA (M78 family)
MLYRNRGTTVIGVNSRHAPTRQRFTVAHEIGHLLIHKGQPVFIDRFVRVNWRNGESNREEVQANAFAAELLMPRALVRKAIERALSRRRDVTPQELVSVLAKSFEVSAAAMQYRLTNLEILNPYSLAG